MRYSAPHARGVDPRRARVAPESVRPLTNVRSTIVSAGIAQIQRDGLRRLPEGSLPRAPEHAGRPHRGALNPVEVAAAHYRAYDALGFAPAEQVARGRRGPIRWAGQSSAPRCRAPRPWARRRGRCSGSFPASGRAPTTGGVSVYKLGPKDAHLENAECPLLESPYFRRSLQGFTTGLLAMVCETIYLHEVASTLGPHAARFRAQWV